MREKQGRRTPTPDFVVDGRGRARSVAPPSRPWGSAFIAAAAAGGLLLTPLPGSEENLIAAGAQAVRNAAEAIRSRSPGLRTRADLLKTKMERAARPRVAHARPRVRTPQRAAAPALLAPPPPALPLVFDTGGFVPLAPAVFEGPAPILAEGAAPCPCLFGFVPPIGGGGGVVIGGGGGGGGGIVQPPPGPPPAVPEPSQWMAMILGFAMLGSAWRKRRLLVARLTPILYLPPVRVPLLANAHA